METLRVKEELKYFTMANGAPSVAALQHLRQRKDKWYVDNWDMTNIHLGNMQVY